MDDAKYSMDDAESNLDEKEVIDARIRDLENSIRTSEYDTLQKQIYICLANGCILLTSFLQRQGDPGWSAELRDEDGHSVLTEQEQKVIESAFAKADWILPFLLGESQEGGGSIDLKVPEISPGGNLLQKTNFKISGQDVSFDRMLQAFLKKTQELDEFWETFGKKDPGFAKLITEGDLQIPTPNPLITIPIPKKPLVQLLITIIDAFRLSAGLAGEESYLLTVIVFLEELITGQWRQMLLSAVGFISPSGMAAGIFFKYIVNAWQLISPDLRTTIIKDMYKGGKSLFMGFLLWCATTIPPAFVKEPVQEAIEKLRGMIQQMDDNVQQLLKGTKEQLAAKGFEISFPNLKFDELKKISMEDIQNLQVLARWPVIVCSKEFQEILKPIKEDPIFRFILELSNIPVLDEDRYEVCKTDKAEPLTTILKQAAQPLLTQRGGRKKTMKKDQTKAKRQTRKHKI